MQDKVASHLRCLSIKSDESVRSHKPAMYGIDMDENLAVSQALELVMSLCVAIGRNAIEKHVAMVDDHEGLGYGLSLLVAHGAFEDQSARLSQRDVHAIDVARFVESDEFGLAPEEGAWSVDSRVPLALPFGPPILNHHVNRLVAKAVDDVGTIGFDEALRERVLFAIVRLKPRPHRHCLGVAGHVSVFVPNFSSDPASHFGLEQDPRSLFAVS